MPPRNAASPPYPQLLAVLRSLLSLPAAIARRFFKVLYFAWAALKRRLTRKGSTGDDRASGTSPERSVHAKSSDLDPSKSHENAMISASTQPSTQRLADSNPAAVSGTHQVIDRPDLAIHPAVPSVGISLVESPPENAAFEQTSVPSPPVALTRPAPVGRPSQRTVFAMSPKWSDRYERPGDVKPIEAHATLPPMTRTFARDDVPRDWITYVHPEGSLYFFHRKKNLITDAYLCDPVNLEDVEMFYDQIMDMKPEDFEIPPSAQLVVELTPAFSTDEILCGYYFVDHENRCLFWLKEFEADYILFPVKGEISRSHIKHILEAEYWTHCQYFPALQLLSLKTVLELKGILVHAIGDTLTSPVSTAPYSVSTLKEMLRLVNDIKSDFSEHNAYFEVYLCRMMAIFAQQKFMHYHGQKSARLSREQTIYDTERKLPLAVTLSSPILFSLPDEHYRMMEGMYVDGIISEVPWKRFMDKLTHEWQDFLLLAEVLLAVDVSFLAIPLVDSSVPGRSEPDRSLAQITAYVSFTATVGSIFVSLLLVRRNRPRVYDTAEDASEFLLRMSSAFLGLQAVAIIFSLPYALLMWGMISFVVSFLSMCLVNTDHPARFTATAATILVLILVVWCIWTVWENYGTFNRVWVSVGEGFKELFSMKRWYYDVTTPFTKAKESVRARLGREPRNHESRFELRRWVAGLGNASGQV